VEHEAFDRLARALGVAGTRRMALSSLLSAALVGAASVAEAKSRYRGASKQRSGARRNPTRVRAEAVKCDPPRPNANLKGCHYDGRDLRSAVMHSSTLTDATFTDANLCGAKLQSSQMRGADLTNANLTRADLHASGCKGADFTGATFCRTIDCNGRLRNDDCRDVPDSAVCCTDGQCGANQVCQNGVCVQSCPADKPNFCPDNVCRECCANGEQSNCANGTTCSNGVCVCPPPPNPSACVQAGCSPEPSIDGCDLCVTSLTCDPCTSSAECEGPNGVCVKGCANPTPIFVCAKLCEGPPF
jgi:hypothetical protein